MTDKRKAVSKAPMIYREKGLHHLMTQPVYQRGGMGVLSCGHPNVTVSLHVLPTSMQVASGLSCCVIVVQC